MSLCCTNFIFILGKPFSVLNSGCTNTSTYSLPYILFLILCIFPGACYLEFLTTGILAGGEIPP